MKSLSIFSQCKQACIGIIQKLLASGSFADQNQHVLYYLGMMLYKIFNAYTCVRKSLQRLPSNKMLQNYLSVLPKRLRSKKGNRMWNCVIRKQSTKWQSDAGQHEVDLLFIIIQYVLKCLILLVPQQFSNNCIFFS